MKHRSVVVAMLFITACSNSDFAGSSGSTNSKAAKKTSTDTSTDGGKDADKDADKVDESTDTDDDIGTAVEGHGEDPALHDLADSPITDSDGEVKAKRCSKDYQVPGMANIWLAGTAAGTSIHYDKGANDVMPAQGPLLAAPDVKACFKAGAKLYFSVSGQISHGSSPVTNADGTSGSNAGHELGAHLGKSNVTAPFNSLLAVFLGDEDPATQSPPSDLAFSSETDKDYATLSPKKGQVFFIGDGKTSSGKYQKVIVPEGVTRLYMGIMDSYEWNNNSGALVGAILIAP